MQKTTTSFNSTCIVRTNENSRQLFPECLAKYTPNRHQDYLRVLKTDKSGQIISILSNPGNRENPLILPALESVFVHLTDSERRGKTIAEVMHSHLFDFFSQHEGATQEDLEDSCKKKLDSLILDYPGMIKGKMSVRSRMVFSQIKPLIEGSTIIDIGAGDGKVGSLVSTRMGKDVTLVEVQDYKLPEVTLPMNLFDGKKLPYKDGQFDSSMMLMVLHHADQPLKLLEEAIRVTNGKIFVMESVYFNREHRQLGMVLEWMFNRVFDDDTHWPCNFQTPSGWMDTFANYNLKMEKSVNLGITMPIVPDYEWLFVLSKKH